MSPVRLTVLALGPLLILATCYALCSPLASARSAEQVADPELTAFVARLDSARRASRETDAVDARRLSSLCNETARQLQYQLPGYTVLTRPPFVLAGTVDQSRLAEIYDQSVTPIVRAVWRAYCDRRPDQPITIVLADDDDSYHDVARRLDGRHASTYAAYYNRQSRRIVLSLSSEGGTLAHELTHALVQADFPELPEWLDEGLASLQEETVFSDDGLLLIPDSNWRSHLVVQAVRTGQCPRLEGLVKSQSFRGEGEGLNYAYVRCLCLYLHEKNLLSHYYRKFRANAARDPNGLETLCELLNAPDSRSIDHGFQEWVLARFPQK